MAQPNSPQISPDILGKLEQRPDLLDDIQDENLKAQLGKLIQRNPADQSHHPTLSDDEKKKQFLEGN